MIYFCADDYGVSKQCNSRIENCLKNSVLNKVSILVNGEIADFKNHLQKDEVKLSLHLNLVEGYPISDKSDVDLLITKQGNFKYSFIGLFLLSLFKKKKLKKQLYTEIKNQINLWQTYMGDIPILIDSHQHTHMIPLVFKTLMQVIKDQNVLVENLRFPAEPIMPYLLAPSLYFYYISTGSIKQCLLNVLAIVNAKELKKAKVSFGYFMGVMLSGKMTEKKIKKLLPRYLRIAKKHNRDIEITLHPGYLKDGEHLIKGCRKSFEKFYFSAWRKKEYDALMNFNA